MVIPDTPVNELPSKTPPTSGSSQEGVMGTESSSVTRDGTSSENANGITQTGTHNDLGDITSFPLFPNNVFYNQLSPGERITLAYQYASIPQPVHQPSAKKDDHEVAQTDKDKLCTSFPVAPIVSKAFSDYVNNFEKAQFKSQAPLPGGQAVEPPASNRFDFKPGFQVSPIVDKWELKIHDRAIPQVVAFDGNVESIQSNPKSGTPKNLKLTDGEWGNIQKASSFSLRGISHAAWFRECALGALDEALPVLNPSIANEAMCIDKLQDVKQFLRGLDYTFDILARLSVYMHAGVTSTLRHDFITQEGKSMLAEEKLRLFTLPYGSPLVFQGQVHKVAPTIKEHRSEVTSSSQLDTVIKLADAVAKATNSSSHSSSHSSSSSSHSSGGSKSNKGGGKSSANFTPKQHKSSGSGRQSFPHKGDSRNRGSSDGNRSNRGRNRGKRGN